MGSMLPNPAEGTRRAGRRLWSALVGADPELARLRQATLASGDQGRVFSRTMRGARGVVVDPQIAPILRLE
jgi:hypothetical protein